VKESQRPDPDPLAACADEPIAYPGSIQPHGWLLVFSPVGIVTHVSANLLAMTGQTAETCIGGRIEAALPSGAADCAKALLAWASQPEGGFVCRFTQGGAALRGFAHRAGDSLILEMENCGSNPPERTDSLQADILEFSRATEDINDWRDLAQLAARVARRCSQFDRVLIYRFDRDFNPKPSNRWIFGRRPCAASRPSIWPICATWAPVPRCPPH
jgi:chemotaxis family two-component system sensor kinase Cph1